MNAQLYQATHFGPTLNIGVSGSLHLGLGAVGKANSLANPFLVANELVAAEIGRYLRLPIPPCCVISDGAGVHHFASLNFNLTGNTLPPIIPTRFYNTFRESAWMILLFDCLIANSDRHAGNLSADYVGPPPRFNVYDHSHTLLSGTNPRGLGRLHAANAELVIDGAIGGNPHCLLPLIDSDDHLLESLSRIESIPDWWIDDVVQEASCYGLATQEEVELGRFLNARKLCLRSLVSMNKGKFKNVSLWGNL